MKKIYTIARREFGNRARSVSYLVTTLLAPVVFVIPIVAMMFWQATQVTRDLIVIVDEAGVFAEERDEFAYGGLTLRIIDGPLAEVEEQLWEEKALLGILRSSSPDIQQLEYFARHYPTPDAEYTELISYLNEFRLRSASIASVQLAADNRVIPAVTILEPEQRGLHLVAMSMAYILGLVLYLMFVIYTNSLLKGVVEEKQNRIVEVVNMVVKPSQLMYGKIFGIGLAGFLQLIVIIALSAGLFRIINSLAVAVFGASLGQPDGDNLYSLATLIENYHLLPLTKILVVVPAFFIMGFLMNGAITAAIGATTNDDGDNSLSFLGNMLNIFAIYFAMIAISMPDSLFAKLCMYVPVLAPIVTPSLVPFDLPWHQILLSLGVLIVAFLGVATLAGKVYQASMLTYGKKMTIADIIQIIRN